MNLDFIAYPLGQFLHFIYNNMAFNIYGLAIIIFTVIIKLVLLPLTIKQLQSTTAMQKIQPQIQEIQKRYKGDNEKLNAETMKLYQENGVNPMGGCLPLLVQMPILISLYYVISQPLKYMLGKTTEVITQLFNTIPDGTPEKLANMHDISILNYFTKFPDELSKVGNLLTSGELINMNFLGLNLGMVPSYNPSNLFGGPLSGQYLALLILPILACVTTYIQSRVALPAKPAEQKAGSAPDPNASMSKSMLYMMPIMTLIFSFSFPSGLSLYWVVGNVIQICSQLYINKFVLKKNKEVVDK